MITKISELDNDKNTATLVLLHKCLNRLSLYYFFNEQTADDDINYILNGGIKVKDIFFKSENNDQDFFNCLLLNLYNRLIISAEKNYIEPCLHDVKYININFLFIY